MANCLGYALHGGAVPDTPDQTAYTNLRTAMGNPDNVPATGTWDAASNLLFEAMRGTGAQKTAGTTYVNAETGLALAYQKKDTTHTGPAAGGAAVAVGTIILGIYRSGGGGSGEHYFKYTATGWQGIAASGHTVRAVTYNGNQNNFQQGADGGQTWQGAVRGWWH